MLNTKGRIVCRLEAVWALISRVFRIPALPADNVQNRMLSCFVMQHFVLCCLCDRNLSLRLRDGSGHADASIGIWLHSPMASCCSSYLQCLDLKWHLCSYLYLPCLVQCYCILCLCSFAGASLQHIYMCRWAWGCDLHSTWPIWSFDLPSKVLLIRKKMLLGWPEYVCLLALCSRSREWRYHVAH